MERGAFMLNRRHPESLLLKLIVCDAHHYSLTASQTLVKGKMSDMGVHSLYR